MARSAQPHAPVAMRVSTPGESHHTAGAQEAARRTRSTYLELDTIGTGFDGPRGGSGAPGSTERERRGANPRSAEHDHLARGIGRAFDRAGVAPIPEQAASASARSGMGSAGAARTLLGVRQPVGDHGHVAGCVRVATLRIRDRHVLKGAARRTAAPEAAWRPALGVQHGLAPHQLFHRRSRRARSGPPLTLQPPPDCAPRNSPSRLASVAAKRHGLAHAGVPKPTRCATYCGTGGVRNPMSNMMRAGEPDALHPLEIEPDAFLGHVAVHPLPEHERARVGWEGRRSLRGADRAAVPAAGAAARGAQQRGEHGGAQAASRRDGDDHARDSA